MRNNAIAAAVLALGLLVSGVAEACSCSEGSLCSRLSAGMIFVARAVKTPDPGIFRLIVEERFAGVPESLFEIRAVNDPTCGMNTEDGQRYLFFGTTLPNNTTTFWIQACSGSQLAQSAGDEIAFLRDWSRGKMTPSIHGKITDQNDQPIADARVTLSSAGRQWAVRGNSSGEYALNDIPPGDYTAVAERVNFGKSEMKTLGPFIRVAPGRCGELNIQMSLATRISGYVVDADGKPAALIDVDLVEDSGSEQTFVTDLAGAFVFDYFGPGTYHIAVGESGGPTSETPFDRRFYPGVESEEKAAKIDVNGPVDLNNLVFRLGKRHATRKVRVRALWENGQPVMNGLLLCHSGPQFGPGSDRMSVPTDLDGTATCNVLVGRDYDVKVERLLWTGEFAPARNSETAMVKAGTNEVSVTIHVPLQQPHDAGHAPQNGKDLERQPGKR